jgi:tRNA (pseudouridine54-N1)-methyltransferase
MRHFVYFSKDGTTSGKVISQGNLMKAGRIDIAIHSFIQAIYLSHGFREDVKFHFILYGMPDPPKHIEIQVTDESIISKKDVGNLLKKLLYKYKKGEKREILPGCFIEKKNFFKVVEELIEDDIQVFILDKKGEDLRKVKIEKNCAFILGDQDGLPKKEFKRLKKMVTKVSIGDKIYFASQTVAVVNNELDYRNI